MADLVYKNIPHLEDLIFKNGYSGLQQVMDILKDLKYHAKHSNLVDMIDGIDILFGRNVNGEFSLVDKSTYYTKLLDKIYTANDLHAAIIATNLSEDRGSVEFFARLVSNKVWPILEKALPKKYKGKTIVGTLSFLATPQTIVNSNEHELFTWGYNQVEYRTYKKGKYGEIISKGAELGLMLYGMIDNKTKKYENVPLDIVNALAKSNYICMFESVEKYNLYKFDGKFITTMKNVISNTHKTDIQHFLNYNVWREHGVTFLGEYVIKYADEIANKNFNIQNNLTPILFLQWLNKQPYSAEEIIKIEKFINLYLNVANCVFDIYTKVVLMKNYVLQYIPKFYVEHRREHAIYHIFKNRLELFGLIYKNEVIIQNKHHFNCSRKILVL